MIVYTDHCSLKSFMTTKQLTWLQAQWKEKLGCCDSEIKFQPQQQATKPGAFSHLPDFSPTKKDQLSFEQPLICNNVTPKTFINISTIECWFKEKSVHLGISKQGFNVDILSITHPVDYKILEILTKEEPEIWTDKVIIACIRAQAADHKQLAKLMLSTKQLVSLQLKDTLKQYLVKEGYLMSSNKSKC